MLKRLPLILLPLLLLGACANPIVDDSASLKGYFKSSYGDGFKVTDTTFTQYDNAARDVSFAGTIVNNPDLTDKAGGLTIKITDAGTWGKTVGKYLVVRWNSLSEDGVKECCPYQDGDAIESGADTKAAAEAEFTIANGYFGGFTEYLRQ